MWLPEYKISVPGVWQYKNPRRVQTSVEALINAIINIMLRLVHNMSYHVARHLGAAYLDSVNGPFHLLKGLFEYGQLARGFFYPGNPWEWKRNDIWLQSYNKVSKILSKSGAESPQFTVVFYLLKYLLFFKVVSKLGWSQIWAQGGQLQILKRNPLFVIPMYYNVWFVCRNCLTCIYLLIVDDGDLFMCYNWFRFVFIPSC